MKYIITLDIGTTAIKTCLFDQQLGLVASENEEYALLTPSPAMVELDPQTYWDVACRGIRSVTSRAGVAPADIAAVVPTTQGETLIAVARDGSALHNAIVWLDTRAEEQSAWLAAKVDGADYYAHTGLASPEPALPAAKILWLKQHRPEVHAAAHKFLLLEDYFHARLTGRFVSHGSMLSSTGFFDIAGGAYWNEMLALLGTPADRFGQVLQCGSVVAPLSAAAAEACGLTTATVSVTGAMDQIASAIGAGNTVPGIVTETTGTALVVGATLNSPDWNNPERPIIYRHALPGSYLLLPYLPTAGIILKWFKDEFCRDVAAPQGGSVYDGLTALAEAVVPGCDGLVLLPDFTTAGVPGSDAPAGGAFCGIGLNSTRGHFVRAIMEAIAFMVHECVQTIERSGTPVQEVRSLGGGSKSVLWNRIKAAVTGKTMCTMAHTESTSLGAAVLGTVALGWYGSVGEACGKAAVVKERVVPDEAMRKAYKEAYGRFAALRRRHA